MEVRPQEPPREFEVGYHGAKLRHVADVELGADEVLTLVTESGTEVDVTRKEWGYYLTPSLNQRLRDKRLHAALCVGVPREESDAPRMYVMAAEEGREDDFLAYLEREEMRLVCWLDDDDAVANAVENLG